MPAVVNNLGLDMHIPKEDELACIYTFNDNYLCWLSILSHLKRHTLF